MLLNPTYGPRAKPHDLFGPVEDAVEMLHGMVEAAIVDGSEELSIDTALGELICIALKERKLPPFRPRMTPHQRAVRGAIISIARAKSRHLRKEGMRAGKANELAAQEAAEIGRRHGDVANWTTIQNAMKQKRKRKGPSL
jgi:hypothetical protein